MACSCGGGLFPNPCNVQPSPHIPKHKLTTTIPFTLSGPNQSHLISKRACKQPLLPKTFLPPKSPKFLQGVVKGYGFPRGQRAFRPVWRAFGKQELVVCFGELLIDFVPTVGGLSLADAPAFKKAPGGAPANVAVGIAKLGGNAAFVGKVGDDEFGYMLVDVLKEHRVETRGCRFDPNARTALAFVTLRADGEREFMFYRNPSADMLFQPKELDMDLIRQASIFHYGSISLISEPSRSTHMEAMRLAKEAGALLSYDPNLRLPLWPSPEEAKEGIKSIWDQADVIKVSDEEVTFLTGGDPKSDENNMKLLHPKCKLMLVTEGGEGCRYYTPHMKGRVSGIKVQVVDTTGAGDAFCAGILSQIVKDTSIMQDEGRLREALRFANACGAVTTTERGAIPALPDKDTVMRLISRPSRGQVPNSDPSWQGYTRWRFRNQSFSS